MSYPISQASSVLSFPSERSFVRRLEYRANLDHAEELERAFPIFTFVPSTTTTTHFFPSNSSLSSSFFLSFSFFSFFSTAALRQESREKRGKRIISDRKNNGGCNHRNYDYYLASEIPVLRYLGRLCEILPTANATAGRERITSKGLDPIERI